jgi:hypothetical protein
MIPREQLCASMGGVYDDNGATCTLQRRSDGQRPSCLKAAAEVMFADDLGPCYDFQRLENSVYRERYRMTDTCFSQMDSFSALVADEGGMCASVQNWRGAKGSFVPSQFPIVSVPQAPRVRECSVHRTQSRCEWGLCGWSDAPTYVQCLDKSPNDCIAMCDTLGGDMVDGECVVPRCRPTQMGDTPC